LLGAPPQTGILRESACPDQVGHHVLGIGTALWVDYLRAHRMCGDRGETEAKTFRAAVEVARSGGLKCEHRRGINTEGLGALQTAPLMSSGTARPGENGHTQQRQHGITAT
jgi:hypothetical protein